MYGSISWDLTCGRCVLVKNTLDLGRNSGKYSEKECNSLQEYPACLCQCDLRQCGPSLLSRESVIGAAFFG